MSNARLLDSEDHLLTDKGKAFLCERVVYRGKDLHHEMADKDWFSLYLYGITGRHFDEPQLKILNYIWMCTSYPDPSIWPNHVTALAGSVRSTASLSLMAGLSISEASVYGRRPDKRAMDFFIRSGKKLDDGLSVAEIIESELKKHKTIYGYGRPLVKIDERVLHLIKFAQDLGFNEGKHFKLAIDVYHYLKDKKGLSINVAALAAALAADFGLSTEDYHLYLTPCFIAGMVPCYIDAKEKPEGTFFPMRCESIVNQGSMKRKWD